MLVGGLQEDQPLPAGCYCCGDSSLPGCFLWASVGRGNKLCTLEWHSGCSWGHVGAWGE